MCLTPAHQYLEYADSMHMHFRQVDKRAMDICMSGKINWNCGHLSDDISGHLSDKISIDPKIDVDNRAKLTYSTSIIQSGKLKDKDKMF